MTTQQLVLPEEEWRPVPGYEGVYEVSDLGKVRRIAPGNGARPGHVLRPAKRKRGYLLVSLRRNGDRRSFLPHRLVALAFLGDPGPHYQVNHRDGDKRNNVLANLEWVTASGNTRHAMRLGLFRPLPVLKGEAHGRAKLTATDVRHIRAAAETVRATDLALRYGVALSTVSDVIRHKTWRHI